MANVADLTAIYEQAYLNIIERIGNAADTTVRQANVALARDIERILLELDAATAEWIRDTVAANYRAGMGNALTIIAQADSAVSAAPAITAVHRRAIEALALNMASDLGDARQRLGRHANDLLRQIGVAEVATGQASGETVRGTSRRIAQRIRSEGVKPPGMMRIDAYAQLVARSTSREASNLGNLNATTEAGYDLVQITSHSSPCPICAQYEGRVYSVSGERSDYPALRETAFSGGYANIHPNCVTGDTLVAGPSAHGATSRRYEGPLVIIRIATGEKLSVTPNHPILTPEGWVLAGALQEGHQVVKYLGPERVSAGSPDNVDVQPTIKHVARAFRESSSMTTARVPVAAEHFHGDGVGSKVGIISTDRFLADGSEAALFEPLLQRALFIADVILTPLLRLGALPHFAFGPSRAAHGVMGGAAPDATLLGGQAGHHPAARFRAGWRGHNATAFEAIMNDHLCAAHALSDVPFWHSRFVQADNLVDVQIQRFGATAPDYTRGHIGQKDTAFSELLGKSTESDTEALSDFPARHSSFTKFADVVKIERRDFSGHVFNLHTAEGWFAANSIITHNCRHVAVPYIAALADNPDADRRQSNQPFTDSRSEREKRAYQRAQTRKREQRQTRNQWERYKAVFGADAPPLSTFASMKARGSEGYQELVRDYRRVMNG